MLCRGRCFCRGRSVRRGSSCVGVVLILSPQESGVYTGVRVRSQIFVWPSRDFELSEVFCYTWQFQSPIAAAWESFKSSRPPVPTQHNILRYSIFFMYNIQIISIVSTRVVSFQYLYNHHDHDGETPPTPSSSPTCSPEDCHAVPITT